MGELNVDAALIVQAVASVAGILRSKLNDELAGRNVPSDSVLNRAIQRLISSKLITVDDTTFTQFMAPNVIRLVLQKLVTTASNPKGKLTNTALLDLLKTCLGSTKGEGTVFEPNRKTVSPKKHGFDYLYVIDAATFPAIDGITQDDFRDILQSAWNLWQKAIPKLKVSAAPSKPKANMLVAFTQLDGNGQKLAEATLRQPGTKEYRLEIDLAEKWNPSKLLGTLTHEIGHVLGIDHIQTQGSIMYFQADPTLVNREFKSIKLTDADVAAIPPMWA
jgi:hypothetical protein